MMPADHKPPAIVRKYYCCTDLQMRVRMVWVLRMNELAEVRRRVRMEQDRAIRERRGKR